MPAVPNLVPNKIRRLQFSEYSCCRHYVPAVSYAIHKYNKAANSTEINLKGLAIGNGLTDPAIQYGAYADFALLNNLVPKPVHDAMKLVSYIHLLTPQRLCKPSAKGCLSHLFKTWRSEYNRAASYQCSTGITPFPDNFSSHSKIVNISSVYLCMCNTFKHAVRINIRQHSSVKVPLKLDLKCCRSIQYANLASTLAMPLTTHSFAVPPCNSVPSANSAAFLLWQATSM